MKFGTIKESEENDIEYLSNLMCS